MKRTNSWLSRGAVFLALFAIVVLATSPASIPIAVAAAATACGLLFLALLR